MPIISKKNSVQYFLKEKINFLSKEAEKILNIDENSIDEEKHHECLSKIFELNSYKCLELINLELKIDENYLNRHIDYFKQLKALIKDEIILKIFCVSTGIVIHSLDDFDVFVESTIKTFEETKKVLSNN